MAKKTKSRGKSQAKKPQANKAQSDTGSAVSTDKATPEQSAKSTATKSKSVGPIEFLKQVRNEGRKVTWTSRNETLISTIMVLIMVAIMSLFFLLVDQVWRIIIPFVLNLF